MSNVLYETLGRVTWAVGKRKVKKAIEPPRSHRRRLFAISIVVVGAVAAGAIFARTNAPR